MTNSVETDEFSAATSRGIFDGTIDFDYDAQWSVGLEGGFQSGPWRFGLAWDYISSEVESPHVVGFLDGVPADTATAGANFALGPNVYLGGVTAWASSPAPKAIRGSISAS